MSFESWTAEELIPIVAIVGGISIAIISIICSMIRSTCRIKEVETTRREVAAYVAEGSMTPDDAERILSAGRRGEGRSCCSSKRA